MMVRLVLILVVAGFAATAQAAAPKRTEAQVSRCLNGKVDAYRREYGNDRDITNAQIGEWEAQCGYRKPAAPRVSGSEAARVAASGGSLFTLAGVRGLLQQRTQGNQGLPVPIPNGRFDSESDGNFGITRVCEDTACTSQSSVIVDESTGDTAFCSHFYSPHDRTHTPTTWYLEGQPPVTEGDVLACPHRLADLRSDFVAAWRQAQRDRGLRPVAFAAPSPRPPARQPAAQTAKASAKACFERKLDTRIAAMGPGQFPSPALAMQWESECAAQTEPGAAAPVAEAPRANPAQTAHWNGQKQTGLVSGQCHYRLEGTEHQVAGLCAHAVSIVVPSHERLAKGGLPSLSFVAGAQAPATVFEYSQARRVVERDGVTTITYRALRTHTGTSKFNRPVAFPGKSIECRYRFASGATTGSLACGITPNTGSFAEAFMLAIRFAPNTPTHTAPIDEGPRLHALMLAAWEALGAK